ncbi:MAG: hypothetical protein C4K47_08680 [Candidatus Thorarchaeota archaeon]|nr:MAG: hypothetical protein C4K47_08680 [Candidatus Thorarchaeota archaeon]
MPDTSGRKNKLFKGLTDHDILVWEEEKMRHQRKVGKKITDIEFLRYLLMAASRPVISAKEGVSSGLILGQGPIYEKADAFLERVQTKAASPARVGEEKPAAEADRLQPELVKKSDLSSLPP